MKKNSLLAGKTVTAFAALLVALALLGSATFAWFTISKQSNSSGMGITVKIDDNEIPVVLSTSEGGEYTTSINFADAFPGMATAKLKPISTSDGTHWYECNYSPEGDVIELVYKGNNAGELGIDLSQIPEDEGSNSLKYFAYADVYIKLRGDVGSGYEIHLNNPSDLAAIKSEGEEKFFGSMALAKPVVVDNKYVVSEDSDKFAVAALRIGFRLDNSSEFWIYEPTADLRSDFFKDEVDNSTMAFTAASDIKYILTNTSKDGVPAASYAAIYTNSTGYTTETWLPKYINDNSYELVTQSGLKTIRQKASTWDEASLASVNGTQKYNCTNIATIGAFTTGSSVQLSTPVTVLNQSVMANADTPAILKITDSIEHKIRIYFWIEGQDIDCWNTVPSGNLFINLELRGKKIN